MDYFKKYLPIIIVLGTLLVILGVISIVQQFIKGRNQTPQQRETITQREFKEIKIALFSLNDSGQQGEAVVKEDVEGIVVSLSLTPAVSLAQPSHIHTGGCPQVGGVKYPLNAVMNGKSRTKLKVSLEQLMTELPLAINVHKSNADLSTYIACGDFSTAF